MRILGAREHWMLAIVVLLCAGGVAAADVGEAPARWTPAKELPVESVRGFAARPYYPKQLIELVADAAGHVHLFTMAGPSRVKDGEETTRIEHYVVEPDGTLTSPAGPRARADVTTLRAVAGQDGSVYLAWMDHLGHAIELDVFRQVRTPDGTLHVIYLEDVQGEGVRLKYAHRP